MYHMLDNVNIYDCILFLYKDENFSSEFLIYSRIEKRSSHLAHNQEIVGSNPTSATKSYNWKIERTSLNKMHRLNRRKCISIFILKEEKMKEKINFEKCMRSQCCFCKYKDRCFKKEVDNERNHNNKSNKQLNR